jgi:Zn finger protein HypA/HybF involved in hydrogenase expression
MTVYKKVKVVCECCGLEFETSDDVTTCPKCEKHWVND